MLCGRYLLVYIFRSFRVLDKFIGDGAHSSPIQLKVIKVRFLPIPLLVCLVNRAHVLLRKCFPRRKLSKAKFFCVLRLHICILLSCECAVMLSFQIEDEPGPCFFVFKPLFSLDNWFRPPVVSNFPNAFATFDTDDIF